MIGGHASVEEPLEVLGILLLAAVGLLDLGEVALSLQVAVLNAAHPACELAHQGVGEFRNVLHQGMRWFQLWAVHDDSHHGLSLPCGAPGDVEKGQQAAGGHTLEALGDVV